MYNYIKDLYDDEAENYINQLENKNITKLKFQLDFSNNMMDYDEDDNKINEFNYLKEFKYSHFNIENYHLTNKTTSDISKSNLLLPKNKRISKKLIKNKLEVIFKKYPNRWKMSFIKQISIDTILPVCTIYKWNWNRLNKLKDNKKKYERKKNFL